MEQSPPIPPRPFLYTLDQVATLINVGLTHFNRAYVFLEGRSVGVHYPDELLARNIAPVGQLPDWRISEVELKRWLKKKGFRFHARGWIS